MARGYWPPQWHPVHVFTDERVPEGRVYTVPGNTLPIQKPARKPYFEQAYHEHLCVSFRGGHWWHPERDSMVDWFCCQCGAEGEGMPKDSTGSARSIAVFFGRLFRKVPRLP